MAARVTVMLGLHIRNGPLNKDKIHFESYRQGGALVRPELGSIDNRTSGGTNSICSRHGD